MILAVKYVPAMYATVWALVPPVVAIVLALINTACAIVWAFNFRLTVKSQKV